MRSRFVRASVVGAASAIAVAGVIAAGVAAWAGGSASGRLVYDATAPGAANRVTLRAQAGNYELVNSDTGAVLAAQPRKRTTGVTVQGASGAIDDTFTLQIPEGGLRLPRGIRFDGGNGGFDTLVIGGAAVQQERIVATGPQSGWITFDGTKLQFSNIEPIIDTAPAAELSITGTAAAETINVEDGAPVGVTAGCPTGCNTTIVSSASMSFESVTFANKDNVTVNGAGGGDGLVMNNPNPATRLTGLFIADVNTVTQTAPIPLTNLGVRAASTITLTNAGNLISNFASASGGATSLTDGASLTIGTMAGRAGFAATSGVSTTGAGDVTVRADSLTVSQAVALNNGRATLVPATAGRGITLGTEDGATLSLTDTEIDLVTANALQIGEAAAGDITFTGPISPANVPQVELVTGAGVVHNHTATDVTVARLGITAGTGVGGAAPMETDVDNLEATTTKGGLNLTEASAVTIGGVTAALPGLFVDVSGDLTVVAGGTISLSDTDGFQVVRGGGTSGNVSLTAQGVTANVVGIADRDAIVAPRGSITLNAGQDILLGTAGTNFNNSVLADGSISFTAGRAVILDSLSAVISDFFGHDTGGGVSITTTTGDVSIGNAWTSATVGAWNGSVVITTGTGQGLVLRVTRTALFSNSGSVTANVDTLSISCCRGISAGRVSIMPATAARRISLGSETGGQLSITDAEIDLIATPILQIGGASSGDVSVNAALTPAQSPQLELVTGGAIVDANGTDPDITTTRLGLTGGRGVGTNTLEVTVTNLEARTSTGGITLANTGAVTIGGVNTTLTGLNVATSGNLSLTAAGTISLSDTTGSESVRGGSTSGDISLIATGGTSDIVGAVDRDAVIAPRGSITLNAGQDILLGTAGANFDNDVRASNAITLIAGRNVTVDGFADVASDDFGQATGGGITLTTTTGGFAVDNGTGGDGSLGAMGTGTVTVNVGSAQQLTLDAPSSSALFSVGGDVIVNADEVAIAPSSGITAQATGRQVQITPLTGGLPITLGAEVGGQLSMTDAEADRIFTPRFHVGGPGAGQITIAAQISPANATTLDLHSSAALADGNAIDPDITVNGLILRPQSSATLTTSISELALQIGGSVGITNTGPLSLTSLADVTTSTVNGAATISAGAVTVAHSLIATGPISVTVPDTVATGENLTVNAGVVISSGGTITFDTGDDLTLTSGSAISGSSVTATVDPSAADGGSVVTFDSTFNGGPASVTGGTESDQFTVTPSATVTITVTGGTPVPPTTPGDTLLVRMAGATNPALTSSSGPSGLSGSWSFGNRQPMAFSQIETLANLSTITGTVFNDLNGDGTRQGGEGGISGRTVELRNAATDALVATAVTNGPGLYTFTSVPPNTYKIRQVVPGGSTQSSGVPADTVAPETGTAVSGPNFGSFTLVTISGRVFHDLNGNSAADGGEAGLGTRTVFLDTNNSGALEGGETSTTTAGDGTYSFTNVGPGTFKVRQVVPAGTMQTTTAPADVVTSSGTNVANVNFGTFTLVSINGSVFNDVNGNGIAEAGDGAVAGRTIFLDTNGNGAADSGEPSTTSAADGTFSFANRGPGTYKVREVVPSAVTQTTANPADITVTSGTNVTGVTFGNFQLITISGRVFNDSNSNGGLDTGEVGIANRTVFEDANSNGAADGGERTATSGSDGTYSFTNLGPGTYRLRQVVPSGFVQTSTNPADVAAASGTNVGPINFGTFQFANIAGRVFNDVGGDGTADAGDPGVSGRTVFLDTNNNGTADQVETSAVTGADGSYSFANLNPGTYRVRQVLPANTMQTTTNPADITVASGSPASNVNFGSFTRITIRGVVFRDLDNSGTRGADDPAISGRPVFMDLNNDAAFQGNEPSVISGNDGSYAFPGLGPGVYRVRVVLLASFRQSTLDPTATAGSGVDVNGVDFGIFRSGGPGYTVASRSGAVFVFGTGGEFDGGPLASRHEPIVGVASAPDNVGSWLVASDGGVFTVGKAPFFGSLGGRPLNAPIVGIVAAPDGLGYWLVASDGGVFAFGSAQFFGSTGGVRLNAPIVGMSTTQDGRGYVLVARDGGAFVFGTARFFGSAVNIAGRSPILAIAIDPVTGGYWLLGADGGVFSFGGARFFGSIAGRTRGPVVGMVATADGLGYWLVSSSGGVFALGNAPFGGSLGGVTVPGGVIGISRPR